MTTYNGSFYVANVAFMQQKKERKKKEIEEG
jgi:hypothetical protein